VVAIDPNMSDLLYCVDGDTKDQTKFRYTQDTRRKETKAKKYRDYLQERKQETVDGKRVAEWEAELSAFNRKTTDFTKFKAYIQNKNELNARLAPFYNEYIFRKLKLGSYMRRQITEARLLARFKKLFGGASAPRRPSSRSATSNSASTASTRNRSRGRASGPCSARRATACTWWTSFVPAAGAARAAAAASARRLGCARTPDRFEPAHLAGACSRSSKSRVQQRRTHPVTRPPRLLSQGA
jgi:hypothetical protein